MLAAAAPAAAAAGATPKVELHCKTLGSCIPDVLIPSRPPRSRYSASLPECRLIAAVSPLMDVVMQCGPTGNNCVRASF